MITGTTITEAQIRSLHWAGAIDCFTLDMATIPYHEHRGSPAAWMAQARERCAEIYNARVALAGAK